MAQVKWIKLSVDMFNNQKIKYLRTLPSGNDIILIWVMLLTLAGRCNQNGYIFLTESIPYNAKILADELGFEESTIILALDALARLNMIECTEEKFMILGWEEHQNAESLDYIREQNRIRKQRQRERQRLSIEAKEQENHDNVTCCHVTNNVTNKETTTGSHATDKEIDIDKDIDINNNMCAFEELWKQYPRKKEKQKAYKCYCKRLNEGYTHENLLAAVIAYANECRSNNTVDKFIKHAATFLGPNLPFMDYLEGEKDAGLGRSNTADEDDIIAELLGRKRD